MRNLLRIKAIALSVIISSLGCYKLEEPERPDPLGSLKLQVKSALSGGSSLLAMAAHEKPVDIEAITWAMPEGGSLVIPYERVSEKREATRLPLATHVDAQGRWQSLYAEQGAPLFSVAHNEAPPQVTHCGKEALIRICAGDESALWITDLDRGLLRRTEAQLGNCSRTILGRALGEERFAVLRAEGDTPVITEWSCDGAELRETAEKEALSAMPRLPSWVEEVEPSVYAWVRHEPAEAGEDGFGDWLYERSDGKSAARIARTELPFPADFTPTYSWERVRREASGALLVDGISGLYRWKVEGDGRVEQLANAPLPSSTLPEWEYVGFGMAIASRSDWNPDGIRLEMPLEYEFLLASEAGYRAAPAPLTPCPTHQGCRELGESYLRGIIDTASGPLGFYVMWPWQLHPVGLDESAPDGSNVVSFIVAPLDRPLL